MTLSSNYNGEVITTANQGFSIKKTINAITKELASRNIQFDLSVAKTGSSYIDFELNNEMVTVRVSNHTKRGWDKYQNDYVNAESLATFNGESNYGCEFQVLNTETFNIFKQIFA